MSRDLNHHRNRHARPEFPTPTACQPPQTPSSDRWTPDFAGALLPEVVGHVWPLTTVQTCILHLIRNTFRLASRRDWDALNTT